MSCAAPLSLPPAPAHARFANWNFSSLLESFARQQNFRRHRRLPRVGDHLVLSGSGEHVWVTSTAPRVFTVDFRDGATSAESLRVGHDEWVAPGERCLTRDCASLRCAATLTDALTRLRDASAARRHEMRLPPPPPPLPLSTPQRGLRIYVYELPAELTAPPGRSDPIYRAEVIFLEQLLGGRGGVRTLDAEEADLFVLPLRMERHLGNRGEMRALLEIALHHIATAYPYWDRMGGRDHVFFAAGDEGGCGLDGAARTPIVLSHWGLLGGKRQMGQFGRSAADFANASALAEEAGSGEWCFAPHKDIVVPPHSASGDRPPRAAAAGTGTGPTLFFAGGLWGWGNGGPQRRTAYSQGVRQTLFQMYGGARGKAAGIHIAAHAVQDARFAAARFCLAPSGMGFGMRLVKSVHLGCVPFVAQPYVVQPFEALLRYPRFSRRLDSLADATNVPQLLNVSDAELADLRRAVAAVRPAFVWEGDGGRAFEYTVLALCLRSLELRGKLRSGATSCADEHARAVDGHAPPEARRREWKRTPRVPWFPPALHEATRWLVDARRRP